MQFYSLLLCVLCLISMSFIVDGRIFNRCSLARELSRMGVPRSELPHWICIAEHESSFNTNVIGNWNRDGSRDWGIFQLNDRYWCDPRDGRRSSNACRIACRTLLSDDISQSLRCAQQVWREHRGYSAWVAWRTRCERNRPGVGDCF